jgi:hypothetical protein
MIGDNHEWFEREMLQRVLNVSIMIGRSQIGKSPTVTKLRRKCDTRKMLAKWAIGHIRSPNFVHILDRNLDGYWTNGIIAVAHQIRFMGLEWNSGEILPFDSNDATFQSLATILKIPPNCSLKFLFTIKSISASLTVGREILLENYQALPNWHNLKRKWSVARPEKTDSFSFSDCAFRNSAFFESFRKRWFATW